QKTAYEIVRWLEFRRVSSDLSRSEEDEEQGRGLAIEPSHDVVVPRPEPDLADVVDAHQRAVGPSPHDDLPELGGVREPARRDHRSEERRVGKERSTRLWRYRA